MATRKHKRRANCVLLNIVNFLFETMTFEILATFTSVPGSFPSLIDYLGLAHTFRLLNPDALDCILYQLSRGLIYLQIEGLN